MKFKSIEVDKVYERFSLHLKPVLYAYYASNGDKFLTCIVAIEKVLRKWQKDVDFEKQGKASNELCKQYKKALSDILHAYANSNQKNDFQKFLNDYQDMVAEVYKTIRSTITTKEKFAGYPVSLVANPLINIQKAGINFGLNVRHVAKMGLNVFLKVFKRRPFELTVYRKRQIPFRNMAKHYIVNELLKDNLDVYDKIRKFEHQSLIKIWEKDTLLDEACQNNHASLNNNQTFESVYSGLIKLLEEIKKEYSSQLAELDKQIDVLGQRNCEKLNEKFQLVDTLDLSKKMFDAKHLSKRKRDVVTSFENNIDLWENTRIALFDDWLVDVEITLLNYSVFEEFTTLMLGVEGYINQKIDGSIQAIFSIINNIQQQIQSAESTAKKLKSTMDCEHEKVRVDLTDHVLAKTIENLTSCFNAYFETFRVKSYEMIGEVSENRAFIKNKNYLKISQTSELKYISPRELLNFEAWPVFKKRIESVEKWSDQQLEKARINLLGLGTVCDFSLESSLVMLEQDSSQPKEAAIVAIEGLQRALVHLDKTKEVLTNIQMGIERDLKNAIIQFDENIQKLKETENIFELNLKIAQIQAVERTKIYKQKVLTVLKRAIPEARAIFQRTAVYLTERVDIVKHHIGVQKDKNTVSFELSEFIVQSELSLKNLPFVYQRLYQLHPTDEDRFFVNRETELESLRNSYENWEKNRYITIALIAEKGSGISSLTNYFLKKTNINIEVLRHTLTDKIYTKDTYFQFFSEVFEVELFQSNEQIIEYINSRDNSAVFVLENLQHMFIKQVNGFDCMNMFFELMAHTMKKILWLGAYTAHSWNYLDKTISISNYFTNEIYLKPMSKESIEEIIFKRNRLSGYQIIFQMNKDVAQQKKFQKMDADEKQSNLRKNFFTALHHLSSGNISLAQLYWLRATQLVNDEEINIAPINQFDFSFLTRLNNDELFAMQAIIIHDGLNLEDFSHVMTKSIHHARNLLIPMLEKGLLIKPKLKYNINPIIFKPVADYLMDHNYLN